MATKNVYGPLFREIMAYGSSSASTTWHGPSDSNPFNWAISQSGNKAGILDTKSKTLYIVGDTSTALVKQITELANQGTLTATNFASLTSDAVFAEKIDLSKDLIYTTALGLKANLDTDSTSLINWLQNLTPAIDQLNATGKIPYDMGVVGLHWDNPRVSYYESQAADNLSNTISITHKSATDGSLVLDGAGGTGDTFAISTFLNSNLPKTQKTGITTNLTTNTFSILGPRGTISGTIKNIEGASGSDKDDVLIGNAGVNNLDPLLGSDIVNGKGGTHNNIDYTLKDRVAYWNDSNGNKGLKVTADVIANPDDTSKWIPVTNVVDMGGGKDTLYDISFVVGSMANDTFTGNSGSYDNGQFFESEFSGLQGADTIKGGAFTRVNYAFDPFGISVNLDKKAISNTKGQSVAGGTAIDGFSNIDKLSNISGIRGSAYDDFINGGIKSESLTGDSGNDVVNGNVGDDEVWGSRGEDIINGGAGIDILIGDHFINQSGVTRYADQFIFKSVADAAGNKKMLATLTSNQSTASVGDIIMDFASIDKLDLSAIDANTTVTGNQEFLKPTLATAFSKVAGELIVSDASLTLSSTSSDANYHPFSVNFKTTSSDKDLTCTGVLLQGDTNGDGVADFSIFFTGISTNTISVSTISTSMMVL